MHACCRLIHACFACLPCLPALPACLACLPCLPALPADRIFKGIVNVDNILVEGPIYGINFQVHIG